MPETKKKSAKTQSEEKSLYQLILDQAEGKYNLVPLASHWAKELKNQEEFRSLTWNETLETALKDVLTGKVTWKNIRQLTRNGDKQEKTSEQKGK